MPTELMQVVEAAREVQLPLLAVLLALAAAAKLTPRGAGGGLAVLVPERLRVASAVAVGLSEAVLAVGLLVADGLLGEGSRALTAFLFAGSAAVLLLVRRRAPEAGCGCFGGLSREPVGWRSLTRAGLLSAAALAALGLAPAGWEVLASFTWAHAAVLGVELLVLASLSPELRVLAARLLRREPCELRRHPLRRSRRRLRRSEVWRTNRPTLLSEEHEDQWRHGCWRFLRHDGLRHGRRVDVVFAVRSGGKRNTAVRATVVDRESQDVLASYGAVSTRPLPEPPRKLQAPRRAARQKAGFRDEAEAERTLNEALENRSGKPRKDPEAGRPV
ncbi:hypothetical protein GCM10007147_35900 [Nocardiopsis kunsanensis]|uniref:Methylamine utilisation protein MauE domain-containing protein n=2 Tax=Nocardiopsis kunsanensis TaxID=141693 RepID=A0A918XHI5_9ACTN|nr:hypothetical protein GCM10007147_35900 [Nocardiopsis kunsanensis]